MSSKRRIIIDADHSIKNTGKYVYVLIKLFFFPDGKKECWIEKTNQRSVYIVCCNCICRLLSDKLVCTVVCTYDRSCSLFFQMPGPEISIPSIKKNLPDDYIWTRVNVYQFVEFTPCRYNIHSVFSATGIFDNGYCDNL